MEDSKQLSLVTFLIIVFQVVHGEYLALIPNEFRPGWKFNVPVTIGANSGPSTLTGSFHVDSQNAVGSETKTIQSGETGLFSFQIPDSVDTEVKHFFRLQGTVNGKSIDEQKFVTLNSNKSLVLVQTDRSIYKPGDTVYFRVMQFNKELKPVTSQVDITIVNPEGSKMKSFLKKSSPSGVIESSYQLARYPTLGTWKIVTTDENGLNNDATFVVDEYVLPKFSVEITGKNDFILLDEREPYDNTIDVKAVYTFGEPIEQGKCILKISVDGGNSFKTLSGPREMLDDGTVTFSDINFPKSDFYDGMDIEIEAEVTDVTDRTETATASFTVRMFKEKIEILESSTDIVRFGMESHVDIRVSDQFGELLGSEYEDLTMNINIAGERIEKSLPIPKDTDTITTYYTVTKKSDYGGEGTITISLNVGKEYITVDKNIYLYTSDTKNSLRIIPHTNLNALRVNTDIEISLESTIEDFNKNVLSYLLISQGTIVEAKSLNSLKIPLSLTRDMCPEATLLVHLIVDKEVLTDYIQLNPRGCFNKQVSVSFPDGERFQTGKDIDIDFAVTRTDGSNELAGVHTLYYLAVDKSVLLLQGSTDINQEKVQGMMNDFDMESLREDQNKPAYAAKSVLEVVGLVFATDVTVKETFKREIMFNRQPGVIDEMDDGREENTNKMSAPVDSPKKSKKIRSNFKDTWLFGKAETDLNGKKTLKTKLLDTITSWAVSAFAVNAEGLAVGTGPQMVEAWQPFFVSLNLPYYIKRGEIFKMKTTVFNYEERSTIIDVKLKLSGEFILEDKDAEVRYEDEDKKVGWAVKNIEIASGSAVTVKFKIKPTVIKVIDIEVRANQISETIEDQIEDGVLRKLIVRPEGEKRTKVDARAVILEDDATSLTETFSISWPKEFVEMSRRVEIRITGDMFGQALKGLDNLVSQPYGCGEQNMITTVPNIFGLFYIRETGASVDEEVKNKMLTNMKTGVERELNYQFKDGSYSAFTSDPHGSTWLTAFVVRSFSLAIEYLEPGTPPLDTIPKAVDFLKDQQSRDGSFKENGRVCHSEMQSSTGQSFGLTVYTVIAMLEAQKSGNIIDMSDEVNKAVNYMKDWLTTNKNKLEDKETLKDYMYMCTLSIYAFSLLEAKDRPMDTINDLIDIVEGNSPPWVVGSNQENKEDNKPHPKQVARDFVDDCDCYYRPPPKSSHIEMASYLLLAYAQLDRIADGVPLMKYLESTQNGFGGYTNTQDTVMVLQALAVFGAAFKKQDSQAMVTVSVPDSTFQSKTYDLSGSKSILTYVLELPEDSTQVVAKLDGQSGDYAIVKVVYEYYTEAGDAKENPPEPPLSVTVKSSRISPTVQKVQTCVKCDNKDEAMYLIQCQLPSGEKVSSGHSELVGKNPHATMIEIEEGSVNYYLGEGPTTETCFEMDVEREFDVDKQTPGVVQFSSYYNKELLTETSLKLSEDNDSTMTCTGTKCTVVVPGDAAVTVNIANFVFTLIICTLTTLIVCL